ncbi:MAG: response regulator transcription factor [Patescibacteria group bacterium]|nr:response regulator transcription factor [Patescibacteria group bacterium]
MSTDLQTAVTRALALPSRQRQVLVCIGRGLLVKETAAELEIAESTVKNTRAMLYRRLGVNNAAEAVRVACAAKLV